MNNTLSKKISDRSKQQAGFALIITISILGFLVIVVLSLASMLRVSTSISDFELQQAQIRQYAWSAAMQGVAKLQAELGSDTSFTALSGGVSSTPPTAAIRTVTDAAGNPLVTGFDAIDYVTGAWNKSGFRSWLFLQGAYNAWKEIVPGIEVRLQRRDPSLPEGSADTGNILYTYWIEDEGMKASARSFNNAYDNPSLQTEWLPYIYTDYSADESTMGLRLVNRFKAQLAGGQNLDSIFTDNLVWYDSSGDPTSYAYRQDRLDLFDRGQLYFLDANFSDPSGTGDMLTIAGVDYDLTDVVQRKEAEIKIFRTLGVNHIGLLTNPVDGGFKKDLGLFAGDSTVGPGSAGLEKWLDFDSYILPANSTNWPEFASYDENPLENRRRYQITPAAVTSSGQMNAVVAPILVDFHLKYGMEYAGTIQLHEYLHFKLWNPYTSSLEAEDLTLVITGLPSALDLTKDSDGSPATTTGAINLDALSTGTQEVVIELNNSAEAGADTDYWLPGRVYAFAGSSTSNVAWNYASTLTGDPRFVNIYDTGADIPPNTPASPDPAAESYILDVPASNITVELYKGTGTGRQLLWRISNVAYDAATSQPFSLNDPEEIQFGYHFRLYEPGHENAGSAADKGLWLETVDFRDDSLTSGSGGSTSSYDVEEKDPTALGSSNTSNSVHDSLYLFSRPMNNSSKHALADVPLFELPRHAPLSIASLQHVHVVGERPFMIGNSWGNNLNSLFDEYYLSGLLPGVLEPADSGGILTFPLPNPRLRALSNPMLPISGVVGGSSPTGIPDGILVVDGAFNVNSTSVEAWESVLRRGLIENWVYVEPRDLVTHADNGVQINPDGELTTDLENAFMRFSQSAHETFFLGRKDSAGDPPREYFRRGVRELTDAQVRTLAEEIVKGIRDYHQGENRPFREMAEFINEGIIETAIDDAGINVLAAARVDMMRDDPDGVSFANQSYDNADIWYHSPFFLSQADVLSAIDPFLAVRSDTYTVRGYAERRHQQPGSATLGSVIASAMVELLVQRTYDEHVGMGQANTRKFQVIGVRWIENQEN